MTTFKAPKLAIIMVALPLIALIGLRGPQFFLGRLLALDVLGNAAFEASPDYQSSAFSSGPIDGGNPAGQSPDLPQASLANAAVAHPDVEDSPEKFANRVLQLALHQSVWGPPAWCNVRQQIDMFDQQLSSFGTFIREGQGSGRLKFKLQFPAGNMMNSLLQISDGQRLMTIENLGKTWRRTMIDLDKVRSRLVINDQSVYDLTVTMYLAIGGQAESLRKLCQQYSWYAVDHGRYGDTEVWLLHGRLATAPAAMHVAAPTDQRLFQECSSGLLPTSVRVAIGKASPGSPLPYWLYQVEHQREGRVEDPISRGAPMRLVTEWSEPKLIDRSISQGTFDAASGNDPWTEETEDYLPPALNIAELPKLDQQIEEQAKLR